MAKKSVVAIESTVAADDAIDVVDLDIGEDAYENNWVTTEWEKTGLPVRATYLLANIEKTIDVVKTLNGLLATDHAHCQDANLSPEQVRYKPLCPHVQMALHHAQELMLSGLMNDLENMRTVSAR